MAANIAGLNNSFIRAEQFVHQAIANKSKETMSIWRDLIELGNFEYGRGYMMKKHSFYGGKEVTGSTGDWYQLKDYNDRSDSNDHLEDACAYNPIVTGYGFEEKKYTIYETSRKTENICLRDIVFHYQFEQQLEMIFNSLSDVTLGAWEKWLRETYITFSTKLVVAEGFPTFTVTNGVNANGVINQAGLREIVPGVALDEIGTLTQDVLDHQYQYLARQAAAGKVSDSENGMPVFALVTSFETSTELIRKDSERNQDFRYSKPSFLLEGYGTVTGYRNFAHSHDMEAPRYKVKETNGAVSTTLERVYPYKHEATTIGTATNIDKDYVYAPYELSVIFLKNVMRGLVPENPTAVSGATFGGASNLGTYKWINIPDETTNLLGETGFMFARYNCAPEPLEQVDNAVTLLHRRHQAIPIVKPSEGANQTADNTPLMGLAQRQATPGILSAESKWNGINDDNGTDAQNYQIFEIVLDAPISDKRIGDNATITYGANGTTQDVTILRDYANGRYRVQADDNAEADYAALLTASVGAGHATNIS
tara:strand:- start:46 stop:1659 length:1614 start_codon:yes stop_codon:yes gene_type:complete